jgi:hypothetical protein
MAASDVDLPEPVPPTTRTRPRSVMTMSFRTGGRPRSSSSGISEVMVRRTAPQLPCCTKALTRKRPMPCGFTAKLHSFVASKSRICRSFMIERTSTLVWALFSGCSLIGVIRPLILQAGGKPGRDEEVRALLGDHLAQTVQHELSGLLTIHLECRPLDSVRGSNGMRFSARDRSAPSAIRRRLAHIGDPRGSPTRPTTGRGACRPRRTRRRPRCDRPRFPRCCP